MVRVALVDDHQPFRERLRALLERDRGIEIVAEAGSGIALLAIALATEMDVVCMDIRLPGLNGVETTRRLLELEPRVRIIGLSAYADPHYVEAMLDAGAVGHFTKGDAGEALLAAIRDATAAQPRFGAATLVPLAAGDACATVQPRGTDADVASLRPHEREVLRLIGEGLPSAHIATTLAIQAPMVDVYRRTIKRKLHLTDDRALYECARARTSARQL